MLAVHDELLSATELDSDPIPDLEFDQSFENKKAVLSKMPWRQSVNIVGEAAGRVWWKSWLRLLNCITVIIAVCQLDWIP